MTNKIYSNSNDHQLPACKSIKQTSQVNLQQDEVCLFLKFYLEKI